MNLKALQRAFHLAGGPAKVAELLNCSLQSAYFYRAGKRSFPTEHGAAIEAATGNKVTRRDIWPQDWQRIWPELAETKAAA